MANEARLVVRTKHPVQMDVANATAIEKGTICNLSDANLVSGSASSGEPLAGIAAHEKIAGDGRTKISVYKEGQFEMLASGAIPVGSPVQSAGHGNYVMVAAVTASGASILGRAMETASTNETITVEVDVGAGGKHLS